MGFFSRFFGLADLEAKAEPSKQPADGASTHMGALDPATAAAVLAEIDIDTAIAAHENWKLRLQNYLNDTSKEDLQPDVVCRDDRCDLGQWLHGPGGQRLGHYPAFSLLVARHKFFHVQASTVVALAQAGEKDKAEKAMSTTYRHASTQVVLLLKELKRGLGR